MAKLEAMGAGWEAVRNRLVHHSTQGTPFLRTMTWKNEAGSSVGPTARTCRLVHARYTLDTAFHSIPYLSSHLDALLRDYQLYGIREVYHGLGFYGKEETRCRLAQYIAWMELPEMYPLVLPVVGDFAYAINQQDRSSEALEWYEWDLRARAIVLGRSHSATTGAINGIGLVREHRGRPEEAL